MRRFKALLLALIAVFPLFLSACRSSMTRYSETYLEYFDTVCTVIGYEREESVFKARCDEIKQLLWEYHSLYDIYHTYDSVNNLASVNASGGKTLAVDSKITDLLSFGKEMFSLTDGKVNIAYGTVLGLWHEAKEKATENPSENPLPSEEALRQASEHTDINDIVIDTEKNTVTLTDPLLKIDVGAIAKGYTAERIAEYMKAQGWESYSLNLGGNIRVIGTRGDGTPWTAGIENPDGGTPICTFSVSDISLVSSGDYQRYFTWEGVRYHHIIDTDTAYPAKTYRSVSVLTQDSGLADALSTALFTMTLDEGKSLLSEIGNAEALWVNTDGSIETTQAFPHT